MRVFLTGATGYIGSALTAELIDAGHAVSGLVRSKESEARLKELGGRAVAGDITQPATYEPVAAEHDVLVHLAFVYGAQAIAADRLTVETLLAAAQRSPSVRQVIYTSGCWVLGDTRGKPVDESAAVEHPAEIVSFRPAHEQLVLQSKSSTYQTAVIRPGMVYGRDIWTRGSQSSFLEKLFDMATEKGAATVIGSGYNHWSPVHREDLAKLYRLVIERAAAGVFHGVDEIPMPVIEAAKRASFAAGAGGKVVHASLKEARRKLGKVADALCLDQVVVAKRSRELGWTPEYPVYAPE